MAVERVVVERHLRIERADLAPAGVGRGGHDQRVDLDERRVLLHPHLVQRAQRVRDPLDDVRIGTAVARDRERLIAGESVERVDVPAHELLRTLLGDLLDVHAAFDAEHHERSRGSAIEEHRRVVLARDVRRVLDPERAHDVAANVHAEDVARVLANRGLVRGELDAAGLAAAADQDLRLDDDRVADIGRRSDGLLDGVSHLSRRHAQSVAGEQLLALVLQQVHAAAGLYCKPLAG